MSYAAPDRLFPFADEIRAVLFDAGNTLLWLDHARIAALLGRGGRACDEDAVRAAEMRARPRLDPFLAAAARREAVDTVRRYVDLIADELGGTVPAPAREAVVAAWPGLWDRVPADAHEVLVGLHDRGYLLGVVSNSDGRIRSRLAAARLDEDLGCVVDSHELGVEKPDPRIFAEAARRLGAPPAACVYVGDFHALDVVGPRAAGMHAVLVDPIGVWDCVDAPRVACLSELLARLR